MTAGSFRFDRFLLVPGERQLRCENVRVDLSARYLDALVLLVSEQGRLVSKDRFMDEVWRGVPVTDEALTQCIKTLRRQLGDDAASPRFIETVPKHGYRFIAPVQSAGASVEQLVTESGSRSTLGASQQYLGLAAAGTLGGGVAGLFGGLFYGFVGASQPLQPGVGAISILLVLACVTLLIALVGAAGVAIGIASAGRLSGRLWKWSTVGGALGGLAVGAMVKLLGLDAFQLLFGRSPADITGAAEGLLLGSAVGFGAWMANRPPSSRSIRSGTAVAALAGGAAGILINLLGGRMMGGSLDLLARSFPDSRLRLDPVGQMFGEQGFGPFSQMLTGAMEGALFSGCVVAAMLIAQRYWIVGESVSA